MVFLLWFSVSEFRWRFAVCMFKYFLVRFGLLRGHLLWMSCTLGWPYVLFVFWLFLILVISRIAFEGWIWVLIASFPGLCNFVYSYYITISHRVFHTFCGNKPVWNGEMQIQEGDIRIWMISFIQLQFRGENLVDHPFEIGIVNIKKIV